MPKFIYTGKTAEGEQVSQTVEAEDRFAVYEIARKNNHTVTTVTDGDSFSFGNLFKMDRINLLLSRVKQDEIVMFTRNLSAMLHAGLPMSRALSVTERQTKNLKLKATFKALNEDLNAGIQLHESLKKYPHIFSRLYVAMVRAGEEGGTLVESLAVTAIQMERTSTLKKKIKGAMIYPAVVLVIMFLIGALMMVFVVPTLTATFKEMNVKLPLSTQLIMNVSDFMSQHTILALGSLAGIIGLVVGFFKTRFGRVSLEWTVVRLPVIGVLVKETNAARTARTLSSLLSSGVDVVNAISITEDVVQNSFYKTILAEAAIRVEKGKPLSEIFIEREDLYPLLVGEMIAVGEETGQISQMLEQIAVFYENEVEQKTKDLSTIIEPLLMVVIGAGVGFFALAMISPIYSISDSIG